MPHEESKLQSLSLKELHESLKLRGVTILMSSLSQFMNMGDVSEQLRIGGKANRREFLPETVDILAAFLPSFRSLKGVAWEQAPAYLRSHLKKENADLVVLPEGSRIHEPAKPMEIAAVQGREQGLAMADEVFTADEAAQFLRVSIHSLRQYGPKPFVRYGKSARGDRWRRSDLLGTADS